MEYTRGPRLQGRSPRSRNTLAPTLLVNEVIMFRHPSARALALVFLLVFPVVASAQGAMTNGANHTGSISAVGEVDQWTFTANQGDALILTLGEVPRTPDPNFWPWIRVTGPTGATLVCGNCWDAVATRMAATAPLT